MPDVRDAPASAHLEDAGDQEPADGFADHDQLLLDANAGEEAGDFQAIGAVPILLFAVPIMLLGEGF